ncbi:hypothetical protein KCP73_25990 [Salmonella enterica subsp. enterica]|nr:hypothetical protein KCP73_25990 [Salmonella enterica subsp. enterica]
MFTIPSSSRGRRAEGNQRTNGDIQRVSPVAGMALRPEPTSNIINHRSLTPLPVRYSETDPRRLLAKATEIGRRVIAPAGMLFLLIPILLSDMAYLSSINFATRARRQVGEDAVF